MSFIFDEKKHRYSLDGELLPGVTTILGTLAKPALIAWASKMCAEYVKENLKDLKDLDGVLVQAKNAHAQKRDKAADAGTDIHALIEIYIKLCIENGGVAQGHEINEQPQVSKFVDWALSNNVVFYESEKRVYSPIEKFAGTVDFTALVNGKRLIGDIKTTSGIYDLSPFLQCAAYRHCLEEMGEPNYEGSVIIRLGKDGSFEEFYRHDPEGEDKETFLALLKVYKALVRFKNQNKK